MTQRKQRRLHLLAVVEVNTRLSGHGFGVRIIGVRTEALHSLLHDEEACHFLAHRYLQCHSRRTWTLTKFTLTY
ncbi:hypothetical protein QCA50_019762 [Cerrena zonata]|uniref:Secreted protein n=1 Tax=Cerrena zonata TaxID=2478898 RepID=A0AAW0FAA2_9APHY